MKIGRYLRDGIARPFFIAPSGAAFDWNALDNDASRRQLREAGRRASASGTSADFCSALPEIEDFLAAHPGFHSSSDGEEAAIHASLLERPLLPPFQPRSFICIGLNYRDHAAESKIKLPERPLLFAKSANAVSGHNQEVRIPAGSAQLDYEAELAVVIGRTCRKVLAADALDYVAGYTCANDLSARDFQFADGQWFRGKSCDGFGPIGPWLVTHSEIAEPGALAISCRVNGNVMQESSTQNLIFGVPQLIEFISEFMTLEAGDVIATGTPPGVGFARTPPVYLQDGDCIEVEIERIGVLRNLVVTESGE